MKDTNSEHFSLRFFCSQIKNNRGIMIVYGVIYICLILFALVLAYASGDSPAEYRYEAAYYPFEVCNAILAPLPILFFSAEAIDFQNKPYMVLYEYQWGRKDIYLSHLSAIILPAVCCLILQLIYRERLYGADVASGMILFQITEVCIEIFVLSAIALLVAVLTGNVPITFLIMLIYVFSMLFLEINSGMWYNIVEWSRMVDTGTLIKIIVCGLTGVICNRLALKSWFIKRDK